MKNKAVRLLVLFCFAFMISLSSIPIFAANAKMQEGVNEHNLIEPNYHDCEKSDLSKLDLSEEMNNESYGMFAHASISSVISSCANTCSQDTCNGYKYNGAHYNNNIIPYTIDESAINEGLEDLILQAVAQWNNIVMYDTGEPVVTLKRNGTPASGRPVCNIMYMETRPSGIPSSVNAVFQYGYNPNVGDYVLNSQGNFRILIFPTGKKVNIITHELGHLLGLADLEMHNVLMGYKGLGIQYQDIQGAALFNLRHTTHTFYRYIDLGAGIAKRYRHICYYCDGYLDKTTIDQGAQLMITSPYVCSSHTYQPMVSSADYTWTRCTNCYKVRMAAGDLYYENLQEHPSSPYYSLFSTVAVSGVTNTNITNIVIPNLINGQLIQRIEDSAFAGQTMLRTIVLPGILQSIGNSAFFNCTGLTNIVLPDSLKRIEAYAFQQCTGLRSIYIPDSVDFMGWAPFAYCTNFKIYVEAATKPTGWEDSWSLAEVDYGAMLDDIMNGIRRPDSDYWILHTVYWGTSKQASVLYSYEYEMVSDYLICDDDTTAFGQDIDA